MTAIDDLNALLVNLPNFSLITDGMKTTALSGALIPDAAHVWPGEAGYVTTYDVYFAAMGLIGFLQAQPVVRQSSSEGTSVAVDAPNWGGLLAYYRGMSQIAQATGNGVLTKVLIPDGPHVRRTDMSSGTDGGRYDNVDTDLD
jgi:hypothetical protein